MVSMGGRGSLMASVLAGVGASLCCTGPLVFLSLGIGGAWVSHLTALEPYSPIFIGLTLLFLGLAFRRLYRSRQVCAPGTPCADSRLLKRHWVTFWTVAVLLIGLLAVPWVAPLFY